MSISFLRDDNATPLHDVSGLRHVYAASGQKEATTGVAIAELDISALNVAANQALDGTMIIMVVCITNPCYFSLGAAASAPADTTTMMLIPAGVVVYMKANSKDVSAYHKQITGAGTLHISVLK